MTKERILFTSIVLDWAIKAKFVQLIEIILSTEEQIYLTDKNLSNLLRFELYNEIKLTYGMEIQKNLLEKYFIRQHFSYIGEITFQYSFEFYLEIMISQHYTDEQIQGFFLSNQNLLDIRLTIEILIKKRKLSLIIWLQ